MTAPVNNAGAIPAQAQRPEQKPRNRIAELGQRAMDSLGGAAQQAGQTTFKAAKATGSIMAIMTAVLAVIFAILAALLKVLI